MLFWIRYMLGLIKRGNEGITEFRPSAYGGAVLRCRNANTTNKNEWNNSSPEWLRRTKSLPLLSVQECPLSLGVGVLEFRAHEIGQPVALQILVKIFTS